MSDRPHSRWCKIFDIKETIALGVTDQAERVLILLRQLEEEPELGDIVSFRPQPPDDPGPHVLHPADFFGAFPVIIARETASRREARRAREARRELADA